MKESEPLSPFAVAVIVMVPAETPVTVPEVEIVAMVSSLDVQVGVTSRVAPLL